jgi:DNA repair protein RAD16
VFLTSLFSDDVGPGACSLCYEPAEDAIKSQCGHVFCRQCATNYIDTAPEKECRDCPSCQRPLTINLAQQTFTVTPSTKGKNENILRKIDLDNFRSSSKVEALVEELTRTRTADPNAKSLVFSQFVSFLDMVIHTLNCFSLPC